VPDEQDDTPEIPDSIIIDPEKLDDLRVVLSLDKLGELIAHVAIQLTRQRGIEPPDVQSEEMRSLCVGGWKYIMHMADRENFRASIESDLAALDVNPFLPREDETDGPEHKSEFGL
jgi:hypothetical protein